MDDHVGTKNVIAKAQLKGWEKRMFYFCLSAMDVLRSPESLLQTWGQEDLIHLQYCSTFSPDISFIYDYIFIPSLF